MSITVNFYWLFVGWFNL